MMYTMLHLNSMLHNSMSNWRKLSHRKISSIFCKCMPTTLNSYLMHPCSHYKKLVKQHMRHKVEYRLCRLKPNYRNSNSKLCTSMNLNLGSYFHYLYKQCKLLQILCKKHKEKCKFSMFKMNY